MQQLEICPFTQILSHSARETAKKKYVTYFGDNGCIWQNIVVFFVFLNYHWYYYNYRSQQDGSDMQLKVNSAAAPMKVLIFSF